MTADQQVHLHRRVPTLHTARLVAPRVSAVPTPYASDAYVRLLEVDDNGPELFVEVTPRPTAMPEWTVKVSDGVETVAVRTQRLPALIAALQQAQQVLAEDVTV